MIAGNVRDGNGEFQDEMDHTANPIPLESFSYDFDPYFSYKTRTDCRSPQKEPTKVNATRYTSF